MPSTPGLIYALLIPCETVLFEQDGTASTIRMIDAVTIPPGSTSVARIDVLFALKFEAGYHPTGDQFAVDITSPGGVTEMLMKPSAVNFAGPDQLHPVALVGVNLRMLLEMQGQNTGIYRLRGYLNGQEVATAAIALVQPEPDPTTR